METTTDQRKPEHFLCSTFLTWKYFSVISYAALARLLFYSVNAMRKSFFLEWAVHFFPDLTW